MAFPGVDLFFSFLLLTITLLLVLLLAGLAVLVL